MKIQFYFRKFERGLSMVELLVTLLIVLMMSLAISGVLSTSESKKRSMTSVNDINQAGNFAMYQLEKLIRAAGFGISDNYQQVFGCALFSSLNRKQILPFPGNMAAPFTVLNQALQGNYRLAPLIIAQNMTVPNFSGSSSDAMIVMSGSSGFGEAPTQFIGKSSSPQLNLNNSIGFNGNDLVMLLDQGAAVGSPCMVEEVAGGFVGAVAINAIPLDGAYYANQIRTADVTNYGTSSVAMNLGNASTNMPGFYLIGVGANNVLYQYDLLQGGILNTSTPIADGVFEMHALYLVDQSASYTGLADTWVSPGTSPFDYVTLENGTAASTDNLSRIKAIRLGLITRTALSEKPRVPPVTTGPIILFSDIGTPFTYIRNLAPPEQNFRYRTIELTIPLRNNLLLN